MEPKIMANTNQYSPKTSKLKSLLYGALMILVLLIIISAYQYVNAEKIMNTEQPSNQTTQNTIIKKITLSERQKYLLAQPALADDVYIDKLVVEKSKREMHAYQNSKWVKTYPIALGKNPIGHKQFEGDKKTPASRLA